MSTPFVMTPEIRSRLTKDTTYLESPAGHIEKWHDMNDSRKVYFLWSKPKDKNGNRDSEWIPMQGRKIPKRIAAHLRLPPTPAEVARGEALFDPDQFKSRGLTGICSPVTGTAVAT